VIGKRPKAFTVTGIVPEAVERREEKDMGRSGGLREGEKERGGKVDT